MNRLHGIRSTRCVILAALCIIPLGGCAKSTYGLFTKPALKSYERIAVLGLSEEQEQIFMASYTHAFPEQMITFVERKQLDTIMEEQDLLLDRKTNWTRLNDNTRARIRQLFGVELLIMCSYDDVEKRPTRKKLRLRIVDSETGAIVGSVISEGRNDFRYHCNATTKALRNDLSGDKNFRYADRRTSPPRL